MTIAQAHSPPSLSPSLTLRKESMSPTAGRKSGMKHFRGVSSSQSCGW